MDEIFDYCGDRLDNLSRMHVVDGSLFRVVSSALFDERMTLEKIGIFLAFCIKLGRTYPSRRQFIYRNVFEVLTQKFSFEGES